MLSLFGAFLHLFFDISLKLRKLDFRNWTSPWSSFPCPCLYALLFASTQSQERLWQQYSLPVGMSNEKEMEIHKDQTLAIHGLWH